MPSTLSNWPAMTAVVSGILPMYSSESEMTAPGGGVAAAWTVPPTVVSTDVLVGVSVATGAGTSAVAGAGAAAAAGALALGLAAAGAPGRLVAFRSFASSLARALALAFLLAFVDFFAGVAEASTTSRA